MVVVVVVVMKAKVKRDESQKAKNWKTLDCGQV